MLEFFERPRDVWYSKMRRFDLKPVEPFLDWDKSFEYNYFTERVRWLRARQYLIHPSFKNGRPAEDAKWRYRGASDLLYVEYIRMVSLIHNLLLFFQAGLVFCAVSVVSAKNPVHSVLFLVLVFFKCVWSYFVVRY